jgi:hypothetical protein
MPHSRDCAICDPLLPPDSSLWIGFPTDLKKTNIWSLRGSSPHLTRLRTLEMVSVGTKSVSHSTHVSTRVKRFDTWSNRLVGRIPSGERAARCKVVGMIRPKERVFSVYRAPQQGGSLRAWLVASGSGRN